jgi:hypothetical protein
MSDITEGEGADGEPATQTEGFEAGFATPPDRPLPVASPIGGAELAVPQAGGMSAARWLQLKAAEQFWYVLQCIAFGAGYFAKIPTKKAFSDAGLARMTDAEQFWYVLQCIAFGAGYFAKIPHKKALSELAQNPRTGYAS